MKISKNREATNIFLVTKGYKKRLKNTIQIIYTIKIEMIW